MIRAAVLLAVCFFAPLPASALGISGGGGHAIQDPTGAPLTQRGTLQCADNLTCEDDSGGQRTKLRALVGPSALYVCEDTGATCNASVSNFGTSPTAALPCLQDALNKLPGMITDNVTIHVASAAGGYDCPATTVDLGIYTRTTIIHLNKFVAGGKRLRFYGYYNPTPNMFSNQAKDLGGGVYSRTSTGGNTNNFPATAAGAVGTTVLNDTTRAWGANAYIVDFLHLTGGTGFDTTTDVNNWYVIRGNTATQLDIAGVWWGSTPDATTTYEIFDYQDNPVINATGANTTVLITSSENNAFHGIDLGKPSLGDQRSIFAWRSRFNFGVGDPGVNSHQSNSTYAVYHGILPILGNGTTDYVADCGPIAYCVYENGWSANYGTNALQASQNGFVWVKGVYFTQETAGSRILIGSRGGRLQVEYSQLNIATSGIGVAVIDNASVNVLDRYYAVCSTTTGSYGLVVSQNASLTTGGTAHRIAGCAVGVRASYQASWFATITPTYSLNTTNESIEASATKHAVEF